MKKLTSCLIIFIVLLISFLSINVYADALNTINVLVDKQVVHPEQNVTVSIDFGQDLGSYTVDIAYDNNLFDFVSVEGGTQNDNGTRIRAYYFDQTGGSNPRRNMSVTFKAKQDILTSNPTDFSITAEGLASPDASITYDDISIPIVKNVIVEPQYVDYKIALNYEGEVIVDKEKEMKLIVSSTMGKNYEHTRIIAEVTAPSGGTAKLFATDTQGLEHDIIQSGWGDASGNPIGGKDVKKELNVRGLFGVAGDYVVKLKLIDRDNSDAEIASQSFTINVKSQEISNQPENNTPVTPPTTIESETKKEENKEPTVLPKTGNTIYTSLIPIVLLLVIAYIVLKKES